MNVNVQVPQVPELTSGPLVSHLSDHSHRYQSFLGPVECRHSHCWCIVYVLDAFERPLPIADASHTFVGILRSFLTNICMQANTLRKFSLIIFS